MQRIWNGERDWYALVAQLDGKDALLVLRVREELDATVSDVATSTASVN